MKSNTGAVRIGRVTTLKYRLGACSGRPFVLVALPILPAIALTLSAGPAAAACVQSGNVVTCSGATSTGFGTGAENNLAVTVQPGASITVGGLRVGINVANGNAALNSGAITGIGSLRASW